MEVVITKTPIERTAQEISNLINNHPGTTLCFLAGGSALSVINHLQIEENTKGRTIFMMGDERWSRERSLNNYLQLKEIVDPDLKFRIVYSSVKPEEDLQSFAQRLDLEIKKIISENSDLQMIGIFGMGTDGHTASIFPMTKESFIKTYQADSTYVPVQVAGLTIDSRASITPDFILDQLSSVVLYAAGNNKKTILKSLINETKPIYEMPAQIIKKHKNSILITDQQIN